MPKKRSLDERIAEMKQRNANKIIKIPAYYATNEVRRARLKVVRERLGMTLQEFAPLMGTSFHYMRRVSGGTKPVPMTWMLLLEKIVKGHKQKVRRAKRREEQLLAASIGEQPKAVDAAIPDDPKLKASVITMHIRGKSNDEIAQALALRPEVVQYWISALK